MEERKQTTSAGTALLVGPDAEQHRRLENELSDWRFVDVPASQVEDEDEGTASADAIVVFAETHQEGHALDISRHVRRNHRYDKVALLVAISIYQMPLAHDVQKLPKAGFIFKPIKANELVERISGLKDD